MEKIGEHIVFPHCDPRVLHAPGECDICDEHAADLQAVRVAWGINFTGHKEKGKVTCPAEVERPLDVINKWWGNRKWKEAKK